MRPLSRAAWYFAVYGTEHRPAHSFTGMPGSPPGVADPTQAGGLCRRIWPVRPINRGGMKTRCGDFGLWAEVVVEHPL